MHPSLIFSSYCVYDFVQGGGGASLGADRSSSSNPNLWENLSPVDRADGTLGVVWLWGDGPGMCCSVSELGRKGPVTQNAERVSAYHINCEH
jgi:hypothetical protein